MLNRTLLLMVPGGAIFKPSPEHSAKHISFTGNCEADPGFNLMLTRWHHEKCLLFLSNGRAEGLQKRQ